MTGVVTVMTFKKGWIIFFFGSCCLFDHSGPAVHPAILYHWYICLHWHERLVICLVGLILISLSISSWRKHGTCECIFPIDDIRWVVSFYSFVSYYCHEWRQYFSFLFWLFIYFLDDACHVHDECHIINQSILHYIYMYVECTWVLLTFLRLAWDLLSGYVLSRQHAVLTDKNMSEFPLMVFNYA